MIVKLLKDQVTHIDKSIDIDGAEVRIEFDVKTIDTKMQARLLDKASLIHNAETRLAYFKEQVACVDGDVVKIAGEEIKASDLAEKADFTHEATGVIVATISKEIDAVIFLNEEEIKK